MLLKYRYIIKLYLLFFGTILLADSISSVVTIDTDGHIFAGVPFSCVNTQTNQFMVSFFADNSYCSLYDKQGNLIIEPQIILPSDGPLIAFGSPIGCYNSDMNQFLITYVGWHRDTSTCYSILDHNLNTIIGPVQLENPADDLNTKLVYCCYNSINKQYCIVWTTACSYAYFIILDALGNIVVPRTEIEGLSIGDGRGVYVSYNSVDNQYLLSWQDNGTNYPSFAIYNSAGLVVVPPTIIENSAPAYATFITSAYNNIDNQYMMVWNDTGNNCYFVICDASGTILTPVTLIAANGTDITGGGGIALCYNSSNNEYFISWNGSDNKIYYTIYSNKGVQVLPIMNISSLGDNTYNALKFNACMISKNIYWFGWQAVAADNSRAYFALYDRDFNFQEIANDYYLRYLYYFNYLPLNIPQSVNVVDSFAAPSLNSGNFL